MFFFCDIDGFDEARSVVPWKVSLSGFDCLIRTSFCSFGRIAVELTDCGGPRAPAGLFSDVCFDHVVKQFARIPLCPGYF